MCDPGHLAAREGEGRSLTANTFGKLNRTAVSAAQELLGPAAHVCHSSARLLVVLHRKRRSRNPLALIAGTIGSPEAELIGAAGRERKLCAGRRSRRQVNVLVGSCVGALLQLVAGYAAVIVAGRSDDLRADAGGAQLRAGD